MPRNNRHHQTGSSDDIVLRALVVVVLIIIAIGGAGEVISVLTWVIPVIVVLLITLFMICFILVTRLSPMKKAGFSLILVALLMSFFWYEFRLPDNWQEIKAKVVGAVGQGDDRMIKVNVGSSLTPRYIGVSGPRADRLKAGDTITIWVNPIGRDEFSLTPRKTEKEESHWLLIFSCVLGIGGLGLLFTERKWLVAVETDTVSGLDSDDTGKNGNALSRFFDLKPSLELSVMPPKTPSIATQLEVIDWFQFEKVVKRVLEAEGWSVAHKGGAQADGGVDLVARKSGRMAIVQCKHWHHYDVDVKVVRELLGAQNSLEFCADESMLFTLGACTQATREFAELNHIEIFGADYLRGRIAGIGMDAFPELMNPEIKFCPRCGASMVWRANVRNPFWGCSKYPRCRGIIYGRKNPRA